VALPGAADAFGIAYYALSSPELSRAAAHHNVVANNFRTLLRTAQGMPGLQESQAPSLKALLDVIDSPFVSALDDCYRKRTSQQGKDHGSSVNPSPRLAPPPQRSKAQRMGLLLGALQSCMPTAIRLLVAAKQDTVVDPVQCCNVDCKGSKQPGVIWCPHCLGLVWCCDCVNSPSCRVHLAKCSRRTT